MKSKAASSTKPGKSLHSAYARARASNPRSAAHSNAPRNAKVAKLQKQARKSAAGLTSALEQRLADRAGHTEMIGAKGKKKSTGATAGKSDKSDKSKSKK